MSWMDRRKSNQHRSVSSDADHRNQTAAKRLTADALLEEIDAGNMEILTRVEEEGTILGEKLDQQKTEILDGIRADLDTSAILADLRSQLKAGFEEEERNTDEQFSVVRTKLTDLFEDQKDYFTDHFAEMTDSVSKQITGLETHIDSQLEAGRGKVLDTISGNKAELVSRLDALAEGQKEAEKTLCEKIHSSSVKNYRNIQSLIEDQSSKAVTANLDASSIQEINQSFKGLKAMAAIACIGGLCGIAAVAYLAAQLAGLI